MNMNESEVWGQQKFEITVVQGYSSKKYNMGSKMIRGKDSRCPPKLAIVIVILGIPNC